MLAAPGRLVGAGVITLEQVFPYTIGANIGTTVTAMLAALSTVPPPVPDRRGQRVHLFISGLPRFALAGGGGALW